MKTRPKSGYDYATSYLCKKLGCEYIAPYGYAGWCEKHHGAYRRELERRGELLGRGRVDAKPVAGHIEMLKKAGVPIVAIARQSGVSKMTLHRVCTQPSVNADTAARIMGVKCG